LIDKAILIEASELRDRYGFSYWDSLIVACALAGGATIVYSEDMHSGLVVENRLQIVNPFASQGAV
jgi:predicted nucleic acid-binding protein